MPIVQKGEYLSDYLDCKKEAKEPDLADLEAIKGYSGTEDQNEDEYKVTDKEKGGKSQEGCWVFPDRERVLLINFH